MGDLKIYESMYVTKQLGGKEDLTLGFNRVRQKRAGDPNTPITQLNASHFRGVMTFNTVAELKDTPTDYMGDYKFALVKETGQYYFFENGNWTTPSNVSYQVSTLDELKTAPADSKVCMVTDLVRGGIFVYNADTKDIDNGGTIIDGWERQFFGEADVKWFGATGNGVEDDTDAIQAAVSSGESIFLSAGTYKVSKSISFVEGVNLRGTRDSIMYMEDDDFAMFVLSNNSLVKNVRFRGQADRQNQIFVLVDGGASLGSVSKTNVIDCYFQEIGGTAYKITNVNNKTNSITNCTFLLNSVGLELGLNVQGVNVTNCAFEQNKLATKYRGGSGLFSNCTFMKNINSISLEEGAISINAKMIFENCVFESSDVYDIQSLNCNVQKVMFSNCVIPTAIFLSNTTGIYFSRCNLSNCSVTFSSSDDNVFDSCITEGMFVTNDYQGTKTRNYFTNSYTGHSYAQFDVADLEGGYLEVVKDDNDYTIPQGYACYTIPFSTVVKQALPYHDNYSKTDMFVSANNVFDFTQFVNPSTRDKIKADITLTLNSAANANNFDIFLYKVATADEDPNQNTDFNKIEAILTKTGQSLGSDKLTFNFCGTIRRGMYKLVVRNNNIASVKILKQGTTYLGTGTLQYKARFWGV